MPPLLTYLCIKSKIMDSTCEIPRWQQLKQQIVNLTPLEFQKAIENKDADLILIDVRTAQERTLGTIPTSIHIDYLAEGFLDTIEQLDRNRSYYLFCRTGRRSVRTGILMKNWGFQHLFNLDGGLSSWERVFGKET